MLKVNKSHYMFVFYGVGRGENVLLAREGRKVKIIAIFMFWWFRSGCFVAVVSLWWFRSGVPGFSTCLFEKASSSNCEQVKTV